MKKFIMMIALVASMMIATTAQAQVKFGLKGGLNVTSMSFSKDVFDASNKTGFFIGPMVKLSLPAGIGFDIAALYDQKEADVTGQTGSKTTIKQKSINVPVNLRYNIGLGSLANVFFFAGPQWGFNVGDKNFDWDNMNSYSLKKATVSVNVGAGFTVLRHLQLSANYNIACGKTADAIYHGSTVDGVNISDRSRNNSWQIALGYYF